MSWFAPNDDGGSPISSYTIYFQEKDSFWSTELNNCNGENAQIIQSLSCSVPLSTFTAAPFLLEDADHVFAKIVAINAVGSSEESNPGNGAEIILSSVPDQVSALIMVSQSKTSIEISWSAPYNGGRPIDEY